jgi:hypothetical protein
MACDGKVPRGFGRFYPKGTKVAAKAHRSARKAEPNGRGDSGRGSGDGGGGPSESQQQALSIGMGVLAMMTYFGGRSSSNQQEINWQTFKTQLLESGEVCARISFRSLAAIVFGFT